LVFGLIRPTVGIVVSLCLICSADWLLGLILSTSFAIFMFFIVLVRRRIGSFSEKRARFSAETDGVFIDTITNSDLVKSFANYFFEKKRFYHVLRTAVRAEQKERTQDAIYDAEGRLIFSSTYLLSCLCIFYFWYIGRVDLTGVVLCTSLLQGLINEVNNIGYFAGEFAQIYGQVKDGLELIYQHCLVTDKPNALNIKMRGRAIKFDKISYHYRGKSDLFKDFSLKIKSPLDPLLDN
jgi:ATP-binding cassette subfamily B protein